MLITKPFGEVESSYFWLQLCDVIQVHAIRAQVLASLLWSRKRAKKKKTSLDMFHIKACALMC